MFRHMNVCVLYINNIMLMFMTNYMYVAVYYASSAVGLARVENIIFIYPLVFFSLVLFLNIRRIEIIKQK